MLRDRRSDDRHEPYPGFCRRSNFADAARQRGAARRARPGSRPKASRSSRSTAPDDLAGLDFLDTYPGIAPYLRGPYPTMYVTQPWTDPPICRLLHGRGLQRLLPAQPRRRAEGPVGRLRSRHPSRLRLRPSARRRRCRHGGRRDRLDLRHAHAVLRHPARPDVGVDDHERRGAAGAGALHRRRRGAGRAAGEARRHDPERHPQRVHGAQHLHLSARRPRCASSPTSSPTPRRTCRSSTRSRSPAITCRRRARRQDLELAYTLADGVEYVRAGLTAGLDDRPLRAAAVVLLGDRHELLHGGRQAARRAAAVGEADEAVRPEGRRARCRCARIARPRAGRSPRRTCSTTWCAPAIEAMAATQGAHPVAAHQRARRGAGAADRFLRPHRAQHAARPAAGDRHHPHRSIRGAARSTSSG